MIDHIGLGVGDYDKAKEFYSAALAPLGLSLLTEVVQQDGINKAAGFGRDDEQAFWIGSEGKTTPPMHFAFIAESRAGVDGFYHAAMASGGRDNGAPGLREQYHPNYYAAFVFDPDGHNIEAVCHKPE
ncbi:VOC family protein [Flaviflagellibacter deserti]|uniref:VOC family protein n=1 Tax=Flaviflagellibacter deserti TaxID=2267266 RepID=A0ABV9Z7X3_9HYPH